MIDDAFKLTIDKVFGSKENFMRYPVQGYGDRENLWFLFFNLIILGRRFDII
jgi:hypothetical protein